MIKFHSVVIFVKDIERSKLFYTEILEEEIEHDFGKNIMFKSGLSLWEIGKNHIIAQKVNTNNMGNRIELYFESEHLETIFEKLKTANTSFLHEIQEEPWGQRTLRFFDIDNHLIEIGEPLPFFIRNMHNKGMSIEEIEKKSGVPLSTIKKILE
ncbi:MAG: glyoxalase [Salinivirgaceae bacterium]|nr:MAG: glyoxalase [Salinivirgaceae bacterium]